ncbi:MAG: TolC family protein [Bdellovibrionales bacterium]|jgi:outer membrane protein TolC|nr:TolC family protein [Bdellovibrionales bacterium]
MKLIIFILLVFWNSIAFSKDGLKDLLDLADKNHQLFKRNQIEKLKAEKEVSLLKSKLFPEISILGSIDYGNKSLSEKTGLNRWDSEIKARLVQNIYNGGREYTYFNLKKIIPKIAKNDTLIKRLDHFAKINTNYFQYKKSSTNLTNLKKQIGTLEKALREVQRRSKIGRVSKADFYSGQSQLQRLNANLISIESEVLFYQSELDQLIGVKFVDKTLNPINWKDYADLPTQWERKLKSIPQIKLLNAQIQNDQEQVKIVKGDYKPTISLESNAYLDKRVNGIDNYDISINLKWSLFSFGQTSNQVEIERAKLNLSKAQKQETEKNINTFYETLTQRHLKKINQITSLEKALKMSQESYFFQTGEYKKGLISYMDLSRSLDDLIEVERQLNNAINDLAMNWYSLNLFLGESLI